MALLQINTERTSLLVEVHLCGRCFITPKHVVRGEFWQNPTTLTVHRDHWRKNHPTTACGVPIPTRVPEATMRIA